MNFVLMEDHHYSLHEIENMIPFEREIFIALLQKKMKKRAQQMASRR